MILVLSLYWVRRNWAEGGLVMMVRNKDALKSYLIDAVCRSWYLVPQNIAWHWSMQMWIWIWWNCLPITERLRSKLLIHYRKKVLILCTLILMFACVIHSNIFPSRVLCFYTGFILWFNCETTEFDDIIDNRWRYNVCNDNDYVGCFLSSRRLCGPLF